MLGTLNTGHFRSSTYCTYGNPAARLDGSRGSWHTPGSMSLADWLSTPLILQLAERYVAAHETQAAALRRLAELKELELGVDPASLEAAARAAGPQPDGTVTISENEDALQRAMTDIAESMKRLQGVVPSPDAVIAEYERQYGTVPEDPEPPPLVADLREPAHG